ncbi:hypothetical protein ACQP1K_19910 [Sphaerimonospora sp. CA-214678]|uniref:hypothetical protein n=1 Tax=Sphaerimonospora sp. CA-214678 TaxID=3240029 RepID=UPI003D9354E8
MQYVAALIGVMWVAHLGVTMILVRRVRRLTGLIGPRPVLQRPMILEEDETVGPFCAVTTAGRTVSRELLPEVGLAAFFSPICPEAVERIPGFVATAGRFPGGTDAVLAVIVSEEPDAAEPYVRMLEPVAGVVVEPERGELSRAFKARGFPVFALLDAKGRIMASGERLEQIFEIPEGARTR